MHHRIMSGVTAAVGTVALLLATAPGALASTPATDAARIAPGAVPGVATTAADASAPVVDEDGNLLKSSHAAPMTTPAQVTPMAGCKPGTGVDNPHISTDSATRAVQGHGWWNKGGCTHDTAHVQSCLYEYYTNHSGAGYWERKNCSPRQQLSPGGGRGKRVTSHNDCNTTKMVSWRNHVDVDVDWQVDTSDVPYRQAELRCSVN